MTPDTFTLTTIDQRHHQLDAVVRDLRDLQRRVTAGDGIVIEPGTSTFERRLNAHIVKHLPEILAEIESELMEQAQQLRKDAVEAFAAFMALEPGAGAPEADDEIPF